MIAVGGARGILDKHSQQNEHFAFVHAGSFRHFLTKMPPPSRREAYNSFAFYNKLLDCFEQNCGPLSSFARCDPHLFMRLLLPSAFQGRRCVHKG